MNHSSERQSPLGSSAFSRHWSSRWVLVNDPAFSTWEAAGRKNTSVPMSSVTSSPVSISGASFQKLADSISTRSRTTSQSSLANALRCSPELADPTAGFSPSRKNPFTVPSSMASVVW
jgi:hypothetical protein